MKKLLCMLPKWLWGGHKRGKRVLYVVGGPESDGEREYQCPRCDATWTRKIRKAKA